MTRTLVLFSIFFASPALHAGISRQADVSGTIGDFSSKQVSFTFASTGRKAKFPRRYFDDQIRPGNVATIRVETGFLRKLVGRGSDGRNPKEVLFSPLPRYPFRSR